MLPAHERLRKTSVFQRAYAARNSVSFGCGTLYVLHRRPPAKPGGKARPEALAKAKVGNQLKLPLVGFSISKKVFKSACKRNRAKRRVREAYRLVKNSFDDNFRQEAAMHRWYALVYVINPTALTLGFTEIASAIRESLVKAGKKFGQKQWFQEYYFCF